MMYMLQVYLLVAVPVFALAGMMTLGLAAYMKVQDYLRARRVMRQIVLAAAGNVRSLSTIERLEDSRSLEAA